MKTISTDFVKITKLHPDSKIPEIQSEGAAGYDLHAYESVIINPEDFGVIKTGIHVKCPSNVQATIFARSGLAFKHSIEVLGDNIGPNQSGEVLVRIFNNLKIPFEVKVNDRIAQMVFIKLYDGPILKDESLSETTRGAKGWGSTGV